MGADGGGDGGIGSGSGGGGAGGGGRPAAKELSQKNKELQAKLALMRLKSAAEVLKGVPAAECVFVAIVFDG